MWNRTYGKLRVQFCNIFWLEAVILYSPSEWYPSCLHTTDASLLSQPLSQTVPHLPSAQISTLPSCQLIPPLRRIEPSLQSLPRAKLHKSMTGNHKILKVFERKPKLFTLLPVSLNATFSSEFMHYSHT